MEAFFVSVDPPVLHAIHHIHHRLLAAQVILAALNELHLLIASIFQRVAGHYDVHCIFPNYERADSVCNHEDLRERERIGFQLFFFGSPYAAA